MNANTTERTREFMAYCKAQGRTPDDQLVYDRKRFPGGCMCGFLCWMSDGLASFKRAHPGACIGNVISDHNAKADFLENLGEMQAMKLLRPTK